MSVNRTRTVEIRPVDTIHWLILFSPISIHFYFMFVVRSMSRSETNSFDLIKMRFLQSSASVDDLDYTRAENLLLRTSRTTTFTLTSSYSSVYNHQTTTTTTNDMYKSTSSKDFISEHSTLFRSHSLVLNDRPRRPTIANPYELLPNLQTLNDWMIVSARMFQRIASPWNSCVDKDKFLFSSNLIKCIRDEINWQMRSMMHPIRTSRYQQIHYFPAC